MRRLQIWLFLLAMLAPTLASANVTPSVATAADAQPMYWAWGNEGAFQQFVTSGLGYSYSYMREPYLSDGPFVTAECLTDILPSGYLYIGSHGFIDGVLVEVYYSEAARTQAINAYMARGYGANDFYLYNPGAYYGIIAKRGWFQRRSSYAGQFVHLGACDTYGFANAFPGVTTFLGYNYSVEARVVREEADTLFARMGGWSGDDKRTVGLAVHGNGAPGLTIGPAQGRSDLELAPMVSYTNLTQCSRLVATGSYYLQFSSPMNTTAIANRIVYGTGDVRVDPAAVSWYGQTRINFQVRGTCVGEGAVHVRSDSLRPSYEEARSYPAGIPLAGNYYLREPGMNGYSPYSDFVIQLYSDMTSDNPAALISGFTAEAGLAGTKIRLEVLAQDSTESYQIFWAATSDGPWELVTRIPKVAGQLVYEYTDPLHQSGRYRLVEREESGHEILQDHADVVDFIPQPRDPEVTTDEGDRLQAMNQAMAPAMAMPSSAMEATSYGIAYIVPDATYISHLQPLVNRRISQGHIVNVVTLADIGGASNINAYIRSKFPLGLWGVTTIGPSRDREWWNRWAAGQLPGTGWTIQTWADDNVPNTIPHVYWLDPVGVQSKSISSFRPYMSSLLPLGDCDGDSIPEVIVTNIPAENVAQLDVAVAKTLAYDNRVLTSGIVGVLSMAISYNGMDGHWVEEVADTVAARIKSPYTVVRLNDNDATLYSHATNRANFLNLMHQKPVTIYKTGTVFNRNKFHELNTADGDSLGMLGVGDGICAIIAPTCELANTDRRLSWDTSTPPRTKKGFSTLSLTQYADRGWAFIWAGLNGTLAACNSNMILDFQQIAGTTGGRSASEIALQAIRKEAARGQMQKYAALSTGIVGDVGTRVAGQVVRTTDVTPISNVANRLAMSIVNNASTTPTIRFTVPAAGEVRLNIYDLAGRHVEALVRGTLQPGGYLARLSTQPQPGIYFARLQQGTSVTNERMVILH